MSGKQNQMVAEIRAAIANGTLTYTEIERRLLAAIHTEMVKEDAPADMALVRACESLLWTLQHDDEALPDNRYEANLSAVHKKLEARMRAQNTRRFVLRTVAVSAAILVLALGIDFAIHHKWLEGGSTPDGQDYVVQGHVVDPNVIGTGIAGTDDDAQPRSVTTTDFQEACSILSFTPSLPTWLPEGWELLKYRADSMEGMEYFFSTYQCNEFEKNIRYEVSYSQDITIQNHSLEQNEDGEIFLLDNGLEVYVSMNLEQFVCSWIRNKELHTLTGPLSRREILKIVNSTKGE